MASPASEAEFLLSCIMHSEGKINFDNVAKDTGYTNVDSVRNRLNAIKRRVIAGGQSTGTGLAKSVAASPAKKKAPATPRKARKTLKRTHNDEDNDGNEGGADGGTKEAPKAAKNTTS